MLIELFLIGMFLAGLSNIIFGFLVYSKNKKTTYGKTFLAFSLAFTMWAVSYAVWLTQTEPISALFWSRMLNLGATLIPVFFLHNILSFLGLSKDRVNLLRFGYFSTIVFALLSFSAGYISHVEQVGIFTFWPQAGTTYTIFLIINFIFLFGYALVLLANHVINRKIEGEVWIQGKYILIGSLISVMVGSANFPLMYGFNFPAYIAVASIFHPFFWGYGAVKHHFFNLKVVSSQILVFALWLFLLIRTFISESTSEQIISASLLAMTIVVGVLLVQSVVKEVKAREQVEKLAQNLEQANTRLIELDRQKDQFLSIASHQFRSPLTAIKGYGSLILEGSFGKVPENIKEPINRIFKSADNLTLIVEDFLNISRIEQGRMKYNFENVDIREMVKEVYEELKPVVTGKGLEFTFESSPHDSYMANIDVGKIRQVVINLIDNSAKYTPKGSVHVKVDKANGKILMSVKDTGVGISEENLGKLFKLFSRTKNAHKVNVSGTGLGLYVARQMVEAHNGRIWAESPGEGKGSTFFMELKEKK